MRAISDDGISLWIHLQKPYFQIRSHWQTVSAEAYNFWQGEGRGGCDLHQSPTTSNWSLSKRQLNGEDGHKSKQASVSWVRLNPRFVGYDEQDWQGKSKETPDLNTQGWLRVGSREQGRGSRYRWDQQWGHFWSESLSGGNRIKFHSHIAGGTQRSIL